MAYHGEAPRNDDAGPDHRIIKTYCQGLKAVVRILKNKIEHKCAELRDPKSRAHGANIIFAYLHVLFLEWGKDIDEIRTREDAVEKTKKRIRFFTTHAAERTGLEGSVVGQMWRSDLKRVVRETLKEIKPYYNRVCQRLGGVL